MKIWFISDTHGLHNNLNIPEVDLIIHCGDESNNSNPHLNEHESRRFFEWFSVLPAKKIFVPGNHSTAIYNGLVKPEEYPSIKFLIHELYEYNGLKIFGSPYTPSFGTSWAYMRKRNRMFDVWENIPNNIDILLTHGPPKGILDLTRDRETNNIVQVGCKSLHNKVMQIKPKIHAFGHIHREAEFYNNGILNIDNITFINCSCLNHRQNLFYNGYILELGN